jgi:hypothetical protein
MTTTKTFTDEAYVSPEITQRWQAMMAHLQGLFDKKKFTTESLLLLIGLQEVGILPRKFEKEEKMNLIHVGLCAVLSQDGYYSFTHRDDDGWPHYELVKALPFLDIFSQVNFMRFHILRYLEAAFAESTVEHRIMA